MAILCSKNASHFQTDSEGIAVPAEELNQSYDRMDLNTVDMECTARSRCMVMLTIRYINSGCIVHCCSPWQKSHDQLTDADENCDHAV